MFDDSGLTGFDSGLEWYVSTRSVVCLLLNLSGHKFIWGLIQSLGDRTRHRSEAVVPKHSDKAVRLNRE